MTAKLLSRKSLKRMAAFMAAASSFLVFSPMVYALVDCSILPASGTTYQGDSLMVNIAISPTAGPHTVWGMDIYIAYDTNVFDAPTLLDYNLGSGWAFENVNPNYSPGIVQFSKGSLFGPGFVLSSQQNVYRLVFPVKASAALGNTTLTYDRYAIIDNNFANITGSRATATFTVAINNPPGAFNLLSPADAATDVSLTPALDWEDSVDPDGHAVTYRVQIDNENTFTAPLTVNHPGISSSNYNVTAGDGLQGATQYYWRVIASDGHGGETIAGPRSFTTQQTMYLHLKALMQGFYNGTDQVPTKAVVELRDTMTSTVNSYEINLGSSGENTFELTGISAGDYYIVVKHKIDSAPPDANHLPIITGSKVPVTLGATTNLDISDPGSPDYVEAYNSDPGVNPDPMIAEGSMLVLRGGDADGDRLVNVVDFGLWGQANGSSSGDPNWDAGADFNGDNIVNVVDFGIWGQNNGFGSYVP